MDLGSEDSPPPLFNELRERFFFKQIAEGGEAAEVGRVFEIPPELAKSLVGLRHGEETPGVEDGSFEVLRLDPGGLVAPGPKPWWHFR